ncbi:MAG: glycosyltransferase family 2 protein [Candidatus Avelusimicrobium sp.]|uniref:glycosyltransferase family 2 protein n=1 Tax=Candidatus Avelusimicrobium sp. TaxID=3048833 RepID=UPI003F0197CA
MNKENSAPELSIVFPCLNEEASLARCLSAARRTCQQAGVSFELVVADNGSTDNSIEIARAEGARVVPVKQKGYGSALHHGILAAQGTYVAFCDADGSYPVEFFTEMWKQIKCDQVDLLLANRLIAPMEKDAMPFLNRYAGTPVLSALIRWLFSFPVYDCNSGMRIMRRDKYEALGLKHTGMAYASEMLCASAIKGLSYKECPMSHFSKDSRGGRPPHLNRWRDGWAHLCVIIKMFWESKKEGKK